ncbi:MAG TPA: UbiA family prenyltransferase [Longimicrobiales bacterium]|nr:UbiA family prenyltransferase [Longimicrobiales bacterium]
MTLEAPVRSSAPGPPRPPAVAAWLRALRPHQWSKNALLLLPALAAHITWDPGTLLRVVLGIAAFSALASAGYLLNDVLDLAHDRAHATKRRRPIAAGTIPARTALVVAMLLLASALALGFLLGIRFGVTLVVYGVLTFGYSLRLKRIALVDVVMLGILYTVRLVAGAALVVVPLSRWFLAFSIFFFLGLALVKRVAELRERTDLDPVFGRDYAAADRHVLVSLGTACALVAALVYCLYITGPDAAVLYARPDLLWAALPVLIYWQARIWLLTERGQLHDDPVAFALTDRMTLALGAVVLLIVLLAR